ncbi:MAG: OmpA family protein [Chitinispirillaceae bacterium]|nr:OmpA family protein [Chitinispirillaceae bacterium]
MPANTTHMYVASRLALDFPSTHKSDVIRDINKGFNEWLQANKKFRTGAENAISRNDGDEMQRVMDAYRAALTTDAVAVFSAFAAGSQGPDLWVLPHGLWDMLRERDGMRVTGSVQFDLGHYNLSHAFPRAVLERITMQEKSLAPLQRKYQTAYILGYLSHIALDITAHIKVNVFAGAYFQLAKDVWENEDGVMPADSFLSRNLWNDHNKIEHFVDAVVRLVCFEGYHGALASFDPVRKNDFEQAETWDFPNYTDYWHHRLKFGTVIKTNGIYDRDEIFLDNATSLPGPFAARYGASSPAQRALPFIHADFLRAYGLCDDALTRHDKSIVNLASEKIKLDFYLMGNNSDFTSQYYLRRWVYPGIARVKECTDRFYNLPAFAKFIIAGKNIAREFIDGALTYLESGDAAVFELLRNWNLDTGFALRVKDISAETDSAYPKKPPRPVAIELVSVVDEVKALASWKPPTCDAKRYANTRETWSAPKKAEPNPVPGALLSGASGTSATGVFHAQSGVDVRLSGFKLYVDADELGAYLWGEKADPGAIVKIPRAEAGYTITRCVEDFGLTDSFTAIKDRAAGQAKVKEYRSTFLGNIPPESPTSASAGATAVGEYGLRPLPRNLRVSLCRKYVFKPTDTGRFDPADFTIYSTPSPTEELCLSLFIFVKNTHDYTDLFSHATFNQAKVEELKHIKAIGVNVVLLLMAREPDASTKRTRLKLLEAYVDGELQPVKPAGNTPPAAIWRVEFEDAHFRTDSAVLMPDSLAYKTKTGATVSPDLNEVDGLAILQVIHVQTKEQPEQKILITGHTDRVGRDAHNISLSADRASSILFLLQGKKDDWRSLADRRNHDDDITQILAWVSTEYGWDCHPGKTEGASYMQKVTAIKTFQKKYNEEFIDKGRVEKAYPGTTAKRIGEDGDCGPDTWGAIFDVYQDALAKKVATTFENMNTFHTQYNGRWVEDANKAVPCGETFPREKPEEDNYESAINRRVEVLFFDPAEMPRLPLPCNSGDVAVTQTKTTSLSSSAAKSRLQHCTDNCPVYIGKKTPIPIPVTPHSRPQTAPTFTMPEHPGATAEQPIDNLIVYLSYYDTTGSVPLQVRKLRAKKGRLHDFGTDKEVTVDGDRDTFVYVSHREDLDTTDRATRFAKDKSGLPLVGPVTFPCGENVTVSLKAWDQNDWVIVKSYPVDGKEPDAVFLADWKTDYKIGYYGKTKDTGEAGFWNYGDPAFKSSQETWNKNSSPVELPFITASNGDKRYVGTLSLHPTSEVKILCAVKRSGGGILYAGSLNELKFEKKNIERNSFHTYDKTLVARLLALKQDEDQASAIDALPQPPATYYLPGDMCWHSQGKTNNCGAYSFAACMNYWYPCTNNFDVKNGAWYADTSRVPSIVNGARTPSNIREAAERFTMHTRENSADDLDKDRALKLLKLWLWAGIPVMILVEEDYGVMSLHWKVVTGYEGNRIFYINSGGDHELLLKNRTAGINYDTAAVGNDVDAIDDGYKKWKAAGSFIVGGVVATSVDPCILMPIYPKDQLFAREAAQ